MTTVTCNAKHTKYQPTTAEWVCRYCGAKVGNFCIGETAPSANDDCELLHEEDVLGCMRCDNMDGDVESGKQFAARLAKKKNLVPCTHCKGSGLVVKKAVAK